MKFLPKFLRQSIFPQTQLPSPECLKFARNGQVSSPGRHSRHRSCKIDIPDLDLGVASLVVLLNVDVDGEMGVDVTHLVLVALGDTNDQVVDQGADGTEGGDILALAVVNLDADNVLAGLREGDGDVVKALSELSY